MGDTQARCSSRRWNEVVVGMWICRKKGKPVGLGEAGMGQGEGRDGARDLGRWTFAWDPEGVWVPERTCLKGTLSPQLCSGDSSLQMLEVATETITQGSESGFMGSGSTLDVTVTPDEVPGSWSWASSSAEMETLLRTTQWGGMVQWAGV